MKEHVYKFAPLALFVAGAGIWLSAFLYYIMPGLKMFLLLCILGQLLLLLSYGNIIRKLYRQANTDSLTGICNRRCFFLRMPAILKMKLPVSLMMIDIDNFKRINDTYGHPAGDKLLEQFAEILKSNTRNTDIVARLGGEEFAIVLPKTSYENVLKTAERIKQAVEAKSFDFGHVSDKVTISIGIATTKLPIKTDCLLECADKALYKAKEIRNAIVTYEQHGVSTA